MKFLLFCFCFLPVCLHVCLCMCLLGCLFAWLFACLFSCMPSIVCLLGCLFSWWFACLLSCLHSSNCLLGCLFSWLFAFLVVCLFVCSFSQPSYKNLILTTFILKFIITTICYFLNDPCCSHTTLYDKHNTHIQLTV